MKRIEDIKKFEDIDTYYEISKIVEEVFQDRVEAHKHLVTANKEIERLNKENKILRENSEHNDKVVDKVNWENKRLNNIINELEKWLNDNENLLIHYDYESKYDYIYVDDILDKLQELKGSVSDDN